MEYKNLSLKETIKDILSSPQYCWDKEYVIWMAKTTPARGKRVTRILLNYFSKNIKILDVGSSQGLTFGYLAQTFPKIIGIDTDKKAIKTGNNRLKNLGLKNQIIWYNGIKLPFKSNSFDGIVASEVFEHVDNQNNFIKELARVLKQNGKLIITAPNKLYPIECEFHLPFLSYLPKKLADVYVRLSGKGTSYDHINHPTFTRFSSAVGKHFRFDDITFKIIKDYKKYHLREERGLIAVFSSGLIKLIEKIPIKPISQKILHIVTNMSPGWVFVCTKK